MKTILWVQTQTETGNDAIVRDCENGCQGDYDELLKQKDAVLWYQLTSEPYKVRKIDEAFFVQGYLVECDYLGSNLPFEFLCYSSNITEVFAELTASLNTLNYHLNEGDKNRAIQQVESALADIGLDKRMNIKACKKKRIVTFLVALIMTIILGCILKCFFVSNN